MSNTTKDKPQKRDGRTAFSLVERFQLQMILANWLKGDVLTVDVGTALKLKLSITASDMTKLGIVTTNNGGIGWPATAEAPGIKRINLEQAELEVIEKCLRLMSTSGELTPNQLALYKRFVK
tara:strand:- start:10967 stop:11332 length:366 start_codon:yes stop_codon:yes gene_type:complete